MNKFSPLHVPMYHIFMLHTVRTITFIYSCDKINKEQINTFIIHSSTNISKHVNSHVTGLAAIKPLPNYPPKLQSAIPSQFRCTQ